MNVKIPQLPPDQPNTPQPPDKPQPNVWEQSDIRQRYVTIRIRYASAFVGSVLVVFGMWIDFHSVYPNQHIIKLAQEKPDAVKALSEFAKVERDADLKMILAGTALMAAASGRAKKEGE